MNDFLKELTELTLKHKIVICGKGVYSYVGAEKCSENLDGHYKIDYEADTDTYNFYWTES